MKLPKSKYTNVHYEGCYIGTVYTAEQMRAFAQKAVLIEREECAKVCDEKIDAEYATGKVDHNEIGWTQACAFAIRARSTTS